MGSARHQFLTFSRIELMTQQQLEKYLWGAATALRGTIDAGDYKQCIFPLLFFKRICDVYGEEYAAFAEHHHFQVPEGSHWKDVRETTVNVGVALQHPPRAIEQTNPAIANTLSSLSMPNRR